MVGEVEVSHPVLVDARLAAWYLCRVFDGPDEVSEVRLGQWVGRVETWAHRFPDRVKKHRRGRRVLYDLGELVAVAESRRWRVAGGGGGL